jgi:hypothetical protein
MTDGERIVWAASYALALDRGSDAIEATQAAARAVSQLRNVAVQRLPDGEDRDLLDEMVSIP